MATTKERLAEIGGWEAMADYHSDDFELGNRIAAKGHRVELMREPVWMMFPKETLGEFLRHELRWAVGLRNVRPAGYVGMIFAHGLPWAIVAATVAFESGWPWLAGFYFGAYLSLRLGVAYAAGVWGLRDEVVASKLWLAPLRDVISAIVWLAGFFTSRIIWRGLKYRVKDGLLEPVQIASAQTLPTEERARGVK
jgi:ceramide glucosyltransferase